MNDRDLLKLAAKAADLVATPEGDVLLPAGPATGECRVWNPLTEDGDALRLAVKLGMYVECNRGDTEVRCAAIDGDFYTTERFNGDPATATRRAIVRTAARIGEKQ